MNRVRFLELCFRLARPIPVPGLCVRALLPDHQERTVIATRLSEAMGLMGIHSPLRLACLQRDVRGVLVGGTAHLGEWIREARLVLLNFDYVIGSGTSSAELTLTLVHEGMHARLDRAGFDYAADRRARVERLCVRAELLLAHRMPNAEHLMRAARQRLTYPDSFWSDEEMRRRRLAALAKLGIPGRIGYQIARFLGRGQSSHPRWRGAASASTDASQSPRE